MSRRVIDLDPEQRDAAAEVLGRELRRDYWRGWRDGAVVALLLVIAAGVAWLILTGATS